MKSINELRNELTTLFDALKTGEADVKCAAEMNNTAGKIINSLKVELEYAAQKKQTPAIPFLEYADKKD